MPGNPDIVFMRARVAVFCDGDFWHGRNWPQLRKQLARRANPDYWLAKITYNMRRDLRLRRQLRRAGWTIVRCWESQIRENPARQAGRVAKALGDESRNRAYK